MFFQYLESFGAGLFISLSGSIPLGNLNLTAMQIAIQQSAKKALWFSAGVVAIEMVCLALTLCLLGTVRINNSTLLIFRIISIIFLLAMAVSSFIAGNQKKESNLISVAGSRPLISGVLMSALNPLQIPFWAGWSLYLLAHSLLINSATGFTVFTFSAGTGTFLALLLFIFAGSRLSVFMNRNHKIVNRLFGSMFLLLALYQFITIFSKA